MGIVSRIEKRSSMATPEKWLVDFFSGGGIETSAGVRVNSSTAMYNVAVYACINILSRTVGSLPLNLYHRLPNGGKEKARKHPAYKLVRYMPNPEMTAMRYRSTGQGHLAACGNTYSYIDWNLSGRDAGYPKAIWPLRPDRVQVERTNGVLKYTYVPGSDDRSGLGSFEIPRGYMMHIPGFGYDGIMGYSPITLAREAIGLGLATEQFGARFFGAGTHPGIIVEHPGVISKETFENLRKSLSETYSGLGQSHRLMLLQDGMKFNKVVIDPKDSQFLETRKFQINEICRLFLVPPHMIADLDRATFSNIEEQGIEFVVHTMRPWFVLWEEELGRCLLREDERGDYFFEFDVDALLRGNIEKRYTAYAQGKQWGWLSTNDIRGRENMNPVDGGDLYMVPLNMIPAQDAGNTFDKTSPKEKNSMIYRKRLEGAFRGVFADAAGRVIRKETKAIRQALKKLEGEPLQAFLSDFYRDMPGYISRQMLPVFSSYSDAILGMESELRGAALDEYKSEAGQHIRDLLASFAGDYIESSLGQIREAIAGGRGAERLDQWEQERAEEVASEQAEGLAMSIMSYLNKLQGIQ